MTSLCRIVDQVLFFKKWSLKQNLEPGVSLEMNLHIQLEDYEPNYNPDTPEP